MAFGVWSLAFGVWRLTAMSRRERRLQPLPCVVPCGWQGRSFYLREHSVYFLHLPYEIMHDTCFVFVQGGKS
jgi:hypothetical protein